MHGDSGRVMHEDITYNEQGKSGSWLAVATGAIIVFVCFSFFFFLLSFSLSLPSLGGKMRLSDDGVR